MSTLTSFAHPSYVLSQIAGFLGALGNAMTVNATAEQRFDRIQALNAKSDAELKQIGIARADIVQHVFKDLYYM